MEKDISQAYKMLFDYHTHTTFSHGKGSIEDNVRVAMEKGLKGLAITDHGPGHLLYGIKRSDLPAMQQEIQRLRIAYPEMELYLGVEANVVKGGACLDVTPEEVKQYDFILAGYHYGVTGGYCLSNWLSCKAPMLISEKNLRRKNTEMAVRAVYENKVKILTHPGDKGPFDMAELAKACADCGTWMEISTWHANLTVEEIRIAANYDVEFIISSDAHTPGRVGTFEGGLQRAVEAGLDLKRIVNIALK